jgi:chorismate mutase
MIHIILFLGCDDLLAIFCVRAAAPRGEWGTIPIPAWQQVESQLSVYMKQYMCVRLCLCSLLLKDAWLAACLTASSATSRESKSIIFADLD